ncbi:unnamed protein product [Brachionus calyciflorus]|uniref:LMBR1 domain-containing protein 2 n=1 Tax=Brachionus calyciflorus TaxID=104777 RepID=A0A813YT86_9BILA|nr:unnamed protein product [Brachionus calyciflorus]
MSAIPLIVEVTSLFLIVLVLLHRYANFKEQNKIILVATFIAWYFSFMIVILLPMDISMTTYRQCLQDTPIIIENSTSTNETVPITKCKEPWSLISPKFFPVLWRIIYWTSQALTWLILPFMQSFCQSGEFSVTGKIKGALIANAIYYGSYLALFGFLLIYVAIEHNIDGPKLKVIGITASNTWGLFLLVLLLGYGLVAVPRSIWSKSNTSLRLKQLYFKLAKLHGEKCEAEEQLEDILNEIKIIAEKIRYNHPFRSFVDIIVTKCPESFRNSLRRNVEDYSEYNESAYDRDIPSEKALVKLNCSLIKALQVKDRTSNEWYLQVEEAFKVEDILLNETNSNHKYMKTMPFKRCNLMDKFCNPTFEWFYYCIFQKYFLRLVSIVLAILTIMVIWSEMTFFNKKPVLSLFAIFLNASRSTYNYISIEVSLLFLKIT